MVYGVLVCSIVSCIINLLLRISVIVAVPGYLHVYIIYTGTQESAHKRIACGFQYSDMYVTFHYDMNFPECLGFTFELKLNG